MPILFGKNVFSDSLGSGDFSPGSLWVLVDVSIRFGTEPGQVKSLKTLGWSSILERRLCLLFLTRGKSSVAKSKAARIVFLARALASPC